MFRKKKSLIFIAPDYHCSFIYRDQLRSNEWKADIYLPEGYPEQLLYDIQDLIEYPSKERSFLVSILPKRIQKTLFILYLCFAYKIHFCYGSLDHFYINENQSKFFSLFGDSFRIYLFLAKLFKCKIVYLPSGCLTEETKRHWMKYENGNVCNNCGWDEIICNDEKNKKNFDIVKRYSDININVGCYDSSEIPFTHIKYKSLDLDLWHPDIKISKKFKLKKTNNLRILHSFYDQSRGQDNKNIKGSPYIVDAINRLKSEGFLVEYMFVNNVEAKDMKYYQAQADIVVEQLIYGWWGSSGVECLALGKPVVCFIRPSFKRFFLKTFKEYDTLPIIEADIKNIYDVLKKVVLDKKYRLAKAEQSRRFAESHYNINKNIKSFESIMLED